MSIRLLLSCTLLALFLPGCAKTVPPQSEPLELVLLHTNDTHSYVAGRDKYGNACMTSTDCVGGMGRIAAVVRDERRKADNVLVLKDGKTVEYGKTGDVLANPQADYTKALLAAVPRLRR